MNPTLRGYMECSQPGLAAVTVYIDMQVHGIGCSTGVI